MDKGKTDITAEKPQLDDNKQVDAKRVIFTPIPLKAEHSLKVVHSTPLEQRPNREHCAIDRDVVTIFHPDEAYIGGKKHGRKLVLVQFDAVKLQNREEVDPVPAIYLYSAHDHHARYSIAYCYNLETRSIESLYIKYVANLSDEERDRLWTAWNRIEVLNAAHKAHEEWRKHVKAVPDEAPKKRIVFKHEKTEEKSPNKRKRDISPETRAETAPARQTRQSAVQHAAHATEEAKSAFDEEIARVKEEMRQEHNNWKQELGTIYARLNMPRLS